MSKYSKKAGENVEKAMLEMKRGKLRNRRGGKKVTDPKQAITIGLSEAKKEGARVPARPDSEKITATPKRKSAKPSE